MLRRTIKIRKLSKKTFKIGDVVMVPEPNPYDMHKHSFVGVVTAVGGRMVMVRDKEGNLIDVEKDRLEKIKKE